MNQLYSRYFQKSFTFLYPILGFPKSKELGPVQVFIALAGRFTPEDKKLICLFERDKRNQVFSEFELNQLLPHPMLDFIEEIDETQILYVFDLNSIQEDYDKFLQGKYSQLSGYAKEQISHFFGVASKEWVYIESFLYPEKYHAVYAEILNIKLKDIQEVHELCNIFDLEKETLKIMTENVTN